MKPQRVPFSELEESDPLCPFVDVRWRGEPFTGLAVLESERHVSEYRYEAGYGEGRCFSTFRSGKLMEEFELHRGEHVGTSRAWFESGQLKRLVRHASPRLEQQWNEAGVLIEEFDEASATRRRWFEDGALRSIGSQGETKEYTRSGELAYSWRPRTDPAAKVYSGIDFNSQVMDAHLEELANDWDREHLVFAWVHSLVDSARPAATATLRRLLAHPSDWVRVTAVQLVGNSGLRELADELKGFLGDHRIPARQVEGSRTRSHTRSFDALAREALARLGLAAP